MDKSIQKLSKIRRISITFQNSGYIVVGILKNNKLVALLDSSFASLAIKIALKWAEELSVVADIPDTIKFIAETEQQWVAMCVKNAKNKNELNLFTKVQGMM